MFKNIKKNKEEFQFFALYAGAALVGAVITYGVVSLKHAPALKLKDVYEGMLSNPYLDDIRKYGITEPIGTPFLPGTAVYTLPMS